MQPESNVQRHELCLIVRNGSAVGELALVRQNFVVVAESSGTKYFSMSARAVKPTLAVSTGIFNLNF